MILNLYKKIAFTFVTLLSISAIKAQVRVFNSNAISTIANTPVFLDASSSTTANGNVNWGKGLLFPRTDLVALTAFPANGGTGIPNNYPTRFDGMIVYNTATSGVAGVGTTQGTLSPGFWYYENKTASNSTGTWKPLGGASSASPVVNITTTEATTNTQIAGAQVYVIKGTFTADGVTTKVSIPSPTGMTGLYTITIFKAGSGSVYARDLYSYTVGTTAGNAVTGSPNISSVYPVGTYDYVLEYLK